MNFKRTEKGFTLIEMLLVMVIIAAIIAGIATYSQQRVAQLKQDRAVLQMQQILNAGMAYYLNNTNWPTSIEDDLQGNGVTLGGYLPGPSTDIKIVNPWAGEYTIGHTTSTNAPNALFAVCTAINAGDATPTIAQILAGRLPMAYIASGDATTDCGNVLASKCTEAPCTVIATVNVPGQNLNNARSVNFAGVYRQGACVAAPKCPAKMKPTIIVTPISVSGMNDSTTVVNPISSFTALVSQEKPDVNPGPCPGATSTPEKCPDGGSNDVYWRTCLQIITSKGPVVYSPTITPNTTDDSTAKNAATVMAITRCMPQNEDTEGTVSGSGFDVFSY